MAREDQFDAATDDLIESWGEIAAYLQRDVKTVQRWERKSGLPVHRLDTGRGRPSIYAYRHEIDQWLAGGSLTDSGSTRPLPAGLAEESLAETKSCSYRRWILTGTIAALVILALAGSRRSSETARVDSPVVRPLTHYPGHEIHPAISPDGRQVAFSWDSDVHVHLVDGANPLQLTDAPPSYADLRPAWSPDGTRVAFLRQKWGARTAEILVVPALGGAPQLLVKTGFPDPRAEGFAWSPDGEYLAFVAAEGETSGISLFSFADRSVRQLTAPKSKSAFPADRYPAFSPDGKRLVVTRFRDGPPRAVIVGLDGTELQSFRTEALSGHVWSPDGESLIFASERSVAGKLRRVRLADGRIENLPFGANEANDPAARGDLLAFSRWRFDADLRSLDLTVGARAKGPPEVLVRTTSREHSPAFSPDGGCVAFVSDRSGVNEVWTRDRDDGSLKQVTSRNEQQTGSPKWSPDGRRIAFDSRVRGSSPASVFVVDARGGEPRRATPAGIEARVPSWSHDGRWIYFFGNRGLPAPGIYRIPAEGGEFALVVERGAEPVESSDGKTLYYRGLRPEGGIWALSLETGTSEKIIPDGGFSRYWAVANEAVYFVPGKDPVHSEARIEIKRFDLSSREVTVAATLDNRLLEGPAGLTVAPDASEAVFASVELSDRDIILVEGIR